MSIQEKVFNIRHSMGQPEKSGYLKYADHKYSTRDDISAVLRPMLEQVEADIKVDMVDCDIMPGNNDLLAKVTLEITVTDIADSDESTTYRAIGAATMDDGKVVPAAATQAFRTWAINNFVLTDGVVEVSHSAGPAEQNTTRQPTNTTAQNPKAALWSRLKALDFSDEQAEAFAAKVCELEEVESMDTLPNNRAAVWADRMQDAPDGEARQKIMKMIGEQAA